MLTHRVPLVLVLALVTIGPVAAAPVTFSTTVLLTKACHPSGAPCSVIETRLPLTITLDDALEIEGPTRVGIRTLDYAIDLPELPNPFSDDAPSLGNSGSAAVENGMGFPYHRSTLSLHHILSWASTSCDSASTCTERFWVNGLRITGGEGPWIEGVYPHTPTVADVISWLTRDPLFGGVTHPDRPETLRVTFSRSASEWVRTVDGERTVYYAPGSTDYYGYVPEPTLPALFSLAALVAAVRRRARH